MSPSMGIGDVLKMAEKEMGESLRGRDVWYTLKFDRRLLLLFGKDVDIVKLVRGNDGHVYLYDAGKGRALFAFVKGKSGCAVC